MRIAVADNAQETDSFSPLTIGLRDFEAYGLYFGEEILQRMPSGGRRLRGSRGRAADPSHCLADHQGLGKRPRHEG